MAVAQSLAWLQGAVMLVRASMCNALYVSAIAVFLLGTKAFADTAPPDPQAIAEVKAHNEQIVTQTPEAVGVFIVQDNGTVRHLQS